MTGMWIAPIGTPMPRQPIRSLQDPDWKPLDIKHAYAAVQFTDEFVGLDFHSFPQRFIAGLPSEEDSLEPSFTIQTRVPSVKVEVTSPSNTTTSLSIRASHANLGQAELSGQQMATLANTLLKRVRPVKVVSTVTDGKTSIEAGKGIVYKAMTEGEAQRNLDFAIANLTSYLDWENFGREEARVREENLRKAEARRAELAEQAKREADLKLAQERLLQTRLKNGLDLYNKVNRTSHFSWPTYVPVYQRELWAKQADEVTRLQRQSNPYMSSIFNSGGIFSANRFSL